MISQEQITVFFFILARLAGIFIQAPVLSSRSFPLMAKTALVVWISIILWFVVPYNHNLPKSMFDFILVLASEVLFGFIIGFICNIILVAVQAAGEMMDMQMGLSVASALDPVFGAVISVIGRLTFFTGLVLFISMDGHHMLLSAFHQSFTAIPAGKVANIFSDNFVLLTLRLGSELWLSAIKIAIPIVLLIFLVDFSFGIVSRVAPQVNVFMLGFQVKPFVGLMGIVLILPFFVKYVGKMIEIMLQNVIYLFAIVK